MLSKFNVILTKINFVVRIDEVAGSTSPTMRLQFLHRIFKIFFYGLDSECFLRYHLLLSFVIKLLHFCKNSVVLWGKENEWIFETRLTLPRMNFKTTLFSTSRL